MKSDFTKCSPDADIPDVWASEDNRKYIFSFLAVEERDISQAC